MKARPKFRLSLEAEEVFYPSSDDQPMAETSIHAQAMVLLFQALQDYFEGQPHFIAMDMFWYFQEGSPRSCRAPDVMVVKDVGSHNRTSFRSWRERGRIPCFIAEMASAGTWFGNLNWVRTEYERLGVPEYFVFDPGNEFIGAPLIGYRLNKEGRYRRIRRNAQGEMLSQELGIRLKPEGEMLRLINDSTGEPILTRMERAKLAEEAKRMAEQARQIAEQAEQAALQRQQEMETEIQRLRQLLAQKNQRNGH